ncbi:hypothetical protein VCRA2119O48_110093 [Vibrio crassostreae]|nr:hypothetical protein VCRA2119O48_110093 [Vibrio crassostreae]CAK3906730.1 hypothetical protein VCRA212O16_330034 [Vibrio crassostreae]
MVFVEVSRIARLTSQVLKAL